MTRSTARERERADRLRFALFSTMALGFTVWVGVVTAEYTPGDREPYRAVFHDVSGLSVGDDVRIAGVNVGKVEEIDVQDDNTVLVSFDVRTEHQLSAATRATIQYRNLIGDRVIQLTQGPIGARVLDAGDVIPAENTASALDIDTLLNGFRPLFAGLSPHEINQLSGQLIKVLQGQQSAVAALVEHVAGFTNAIGNRAELVGRVIGNLNSVLGAVDESAGSLGELIDALDALINGLDQQDTQLLDAAAKVDRFASRTASLLAHGREDVRRDLQQLAVSARGINRDATTLEHLLEALPLHYRALQNSASYGNFFNFYLCGSRELTDAGMGEWNFSDAARCKR